MILKDKLSEKQRKVLIFLAVSAAVYLSFRFLLPIVLPFFASYLIARMIFPVAEWAQKKWRLPQGLTAAVMLFAMGAVLIFLGILLVRKLLGQIGVLVEKIPGYEQAFHDWLMQLSAYGEKWFHMKRDDLFARMWKLLEDGWKSLSEQITPYLIEHSAGFFAGFVGITTIFVLIQVGVLLCIKEMGDIRRLETHSLFSREIQMVKEPIARVGKAYLRTQCIILLIVIGELMFGLSVMGNQYSLLLGLLIGLLDALPLFGTGTVLIPWILIALISGHIGKAVMVAVLYLVCYFTRQLLEPKLMGSGTGLSSLETLIAIYAGLQLFGLWGLFLGPIAWLLVKECTQAYAR